MTVWQRRVDRWTIRAAGFTAVVMVVLIVFSEVFPSGSSPPVTSTSSAPTSSVTSLITITATPSIFASSITETPTYGEGLQTWEAMDPVRQQMRAEIAREVATAWTDQRTRVAYEIDSAAGRAAATAVAKEADRVLHQGPTGTSGGTEHPAGS